MNSFRYEHKFLIPKDCDREAKALIKLHSANFSSAYYPRRVNNIYLDAYDWRHYNATIDGEERRVKVRIRWYGQLFGEIEKPVLELKYKFGSASKKKPFLLAPFVLNEHFCQKTLRDVFDASELPDFLRSDLLHLECRLLNSYSREYFMSHDKTFRLTLDSDMEFSSIDSHKNSFVHRRKGDSHIVMELKYDLDQNAKAHQITNHFPYRVTKNSKYSNGIQALYL